MLTIQIKNWENEIIATIGNIFSLQVDDEVNKGWKMKLRFPAEERLRKQPLQKWYRVSVYYWLKIWSVINLFEWYITDITVKTTEVVMEAENWLSYLQNRIVRTKKSYNNIPAKTVIEWIFNELNTSSELPIVLWLNDDETAITKDFDIGTSFYDILKYCRTANPKMICRIVNAWDYHFLECSENAGKVLSWVWDYDARNTMWTNIVDWSRKDSMDKFYSYLQNASWSALNEEFYNRTKLLFEKYEEEWSLALPNGIAIPSIAISRDTDWWDFTPWDRKYIRILTWYDRLPLEYLWLIQSRKVVINAKGWIKTEIKVSDEYKSDTNILDLVLQNLRGKKPWTSWEWPDMSNYYTKEATNQAINQAVSTKADVQHTHLVSDITNFAQAVWGLISNALVDYITSSDLQNALSGYSQTGHTHSISDVDELEASLSDKANAVHSHTVSDITDFASAVASAISWKADTWHTHTISDISWLQNALDNKASSVHSHTIAQITGLQDALNSKANSSDVYSKSQVYTKTEVDEMIPTVQTVYDSTITIQVNWNTIKSITLNQANGDTINIPVPTKTSDLTNDSWFITKAVSDLTNYYTKTQTYTKTEVDNMISNFWWFEVVSTLPTTNIKTNVIYLKWPIGTWSDRYEEWIYYSNTWTMIGETSVDLTNYFNVSTDTADRITEWSSHLFMTTAERSKLSWIEAQAQKNTITWVKWSAESEYRVGNVNITKANIWLWNVDNTSDENKPISNATQEALNLKMNKAEKRLFVITEDMVTVSTDSTKWVAPYNASYWYTNITIDSNAWVQRVEWAFYHFEVNTEMVVASAYRNVRVRIWDWAYIPMKNRANSILAGSSYMTKWRTQFFAYKTVYESWGALHLSVDTSYSAMSVAEWQTGTATSGRVVRADYLKQIIKYHSVNDTAFWDSWDGETDIAPSKNAVYDKLKSMETAIWNKANDSDVVKKTGNQSISWTKTFTTSPVVPSKSTEAGDNPTTIATEKQVKNVKDSIGGWTLTLLYGDDEELWTFWANQSTNKTIKIPAWSSINELTENFVRTMIFAWVKDFDNVFRASSWLYRILNAMDENDNLWLTEWEVWEDLMSSSSSMSMISHSFSVMTAIASSKVAMDELLSNNNAVKEVSECWNSIYIIAQSELASELYLSSEYWIANLFTYQTAQDAFFTNQEIKESIVNEYIMTIVNSNTLLTNLHNDTTVENAIVNSSEALYTIAWNWTKIGIVDDNETIMTALAGDSSALWNMTNANLTTYFLESDDYLTTITSTTAGQDRINSMTADSLLPAIYFRTWLSWYASFEALAQDENARDTVENSEESMLIIQCNEEANEYFWNVPSDYIELEYIWSSASQYINTWYVPNVNTEIETVISWWGSQTWRWVFFWVTSNDQWSDWVLWRIYNTTTTNFNPRFCNTAYDECQFTWVATDTFHNIILKKNYASVDWTAKTLTTTWTPYQSPIYLFCWNNGGSAWRHTSCKIKTFKISENGVLIKDFYPCLRKSDSALWLRDKVNKVFYANSWSWTFSAWQPIVTRSKVQFVEYIQSSWTQYIDTWYVPKSTSEFEVKFNNVSAINTYRTVLWTRNTTSDNAFWIWRMNSKSYFELSPANTENTTSTWWFNTGVDYTVKLQNKTITNNWQTVASSINFTQDAIYNLYLFSGNQKNSWLFESCASKMYYCKLYEWNTLVRDFKPCYVKWTTIAWMWDEVEKKFYWNIWSWAFTKWEDI